MGSAGDLEIPQHVLDICRILVEAGWQAYVVGGGVRDALLGRRPKDWDVATDAPPQRVQRLFHRTAPTGLRFGTITVLEPGPGVEVTTFRGEAGYADGRRPDDVRFLRDIVTDLTRRDFTVNAIAYDPGKKEMIDPHGGRADLQRRRLRAVGDPDDRFNEDGLRVLRAVRLATELDFNLEDRTGEALRRNRAVLGRISRERIGEEWRRMLISPAPERGVGLLAHYDLLPLVLNRAQQTAMTGPPLSRMLAALERLQDVPKDKNTFDEGPRTPSLQDLFVARSAAALHGLVAPHEQAKQLRELVYPKRVSRVVLAVLRLLEALSPDPVLTDPQLRRLLGQAGRESLFAFRLAWAAHRHPIDPAQVDIRVATMLQDGDPLTPKDVALNGGDVQRLLKAPSGRAIGGWLRRMYDHVLHYPQDNTRDRLSKLLLRWVGEDD